MEQGEATPPGEFPEDRPDPAPPVFSQNSPEPLKPIREVDDAKLLIVDGEASFMGRGAVLTDKDQAQIAGIILRAAARDLKAKLDEIGAVMPRKARKRKKVAK